VKDETIKEQKGAVCESRHIHQSKTLEPIPSLMSHRFDEIHRLTTTLTTLQFDPYSPISYHFMTTETHNLFFRTTTNLLHPAVLGTIIVNLVQLIFSGELLKDVQVHGLFPLLASAILVWYFVLDFWVTTVAFEKQPGQYGLKPFLTDILILVLLSASFYCLWVTHSDFWFFITVVAQIIGIVVWNSAAGTNPFSLRNRYTQLLLGCALVCAIPILTSAFALPVHLAAKYVVLVALTCFLIFYTHLILTD
jgi:hypothetical protein